VRAKAGAKTAAPRLAGPVPSHSSSSSSSSFSSNSPAVPFSVFCSFASRCLSVCPIYLRVYSYLIACVLVASAASLIARRCAFSWASCSLFTVSGPVSKRLLVLYSFTFLPLYLGVRSNILIGRSYLINTFLLILIRLS